MADHEQDKNPKKPPKIKLEQPNGNGLPKPKVPGEGIQDAAAGGPAEDTIRIELGGADAGSEGLKPPKGSLRPKEDTTRIDLPTSPTPGAKPPSKSDTARLDLSSAKPPQPAPAGEDTERIDLKAGKPPKPDTARIDLKTAKPQKPDTARIDIKTAKPQKPDTARIDIKTAKPQKPDTARIDLSKTFDVTQPMEAPAPAETQPVAPAASAPSDTARIKLETATPPGQSETEPIPPSEAPTRGVTQLTDEEREEILKQSTMRVETEGAQATGGISEQDVSDAERERILKQSTMRVETEGAQATGGISEQDVSDEERDRILKQSTMRVETEGAAAAGAVTEQDLSDEERDRILKQSTMRVESEGIQAPESPMSAVKNKTMRVELEQEAKGKSETARIELPRAGAKGESARISIKDDEGSDDVFRRHASTAVAPAAAAAGAKLTPKKSETVKTELDRPVVAPGPTEVIPAKSETARIEMAPEAEAAQAGRPKTIKIKRAESPPMRATAAPQASVKRPGLKVVGEPSDIGVVYTIVALASVIVIGALLYVLAAQTIATNLPFMGKIG